MDWFFRSLNLNNPQFREDLLDCKKCQVSPPLKRSEVYKKETKCCLFSPTLSCFALGELISQSHSKWDPPIGLDWTLMGAVHPLEHRNNSQALCQYFSKELGECGVWKQRPAICQTFFCVSRFGESGLRLYNQMENWMMLTEAKILKLWFDYKIGDEDLWDLWCEYMEENPQIQSLPGEFQFGSYKEAESVYVESLDFLQNDAAVSKILLQSKVTGEKLLAQLGQL